MKKLCSMLLVLALCASLFPSALAAESEETSKVPDYQRMQQDMDGRWFVGVNVEQKPVVKETEGEGTDGWRYGMVDSDGETILLPIIYERRYNETGLCFRSGYFVLYKDNVYGLRNYQLEEVLPMEYDYLDLWGYQILEYRKDGEHGLLFLNSGVTVLLEDDDVVEQTEPNFVIVRSAEWREYLYNRDGTLLYDTQDRDESIRTDENNKPQISTGHGEAQVLTDIPAVTAVSAWAETTVNSAREAELIPADVDFLYTDKITRADFCVLAMQLISTVAPELAESASTETEFWDTYTQSGGDRKWPEISAAADLGLVKGFLDEGFHPFDTLTRQDAAVILQRLVSLLGLEAESVSDTSGQFSDLESAGAYAQDPICRITGSHFAGDTVLMNGVSETSFDPLGTLTKEQAIAILYRVYLAAAAG